MNNSSYVFISLYRTYVWFCIQASLCEGESKEKFLAANIDLNAKVVAQSAARERLQIAREAVNDKHRELLKTTRDDPFKVHALGALALLVLRPKRGTTLVKK